PPGLGPPEAKPLVSALTDVVAAQGVALLLVEHDVQMVMEVCDVIQVLEFGQTIAVGTPSQVREDAAVRSAYLGDQLDVAGDEAHPQHSSTSTTTARYRDESASRPRSAAP